MLPPNQCPCSPHFIIIPTSTTPGPSYLISLYGSKRRDKREFF